VIVNTARIGEIVKRHRPRGWRVRESKHRFKVNSGLADHNRRTLYVPTLIDESALFLFLHECGHVKHRHFDSDVNQPIHRDEFEAEQYAIHVFKNEGIRLPRELLSRARERVRHWIAHDEKHGVPIQAHVRRWAER
jgi:hypothetical protein